MTFARDHWALILGGSSGFGLATAHKLAAHGMNLCLVHRDRRGAMARIEPEFAALRATGVRVVTFNADALDAATRGTLLDGLAAELGATGRVRLLLHSIAFGNLKLLVPERRAERAGALPALARALGVEQQMLAGAVDRLFADGFDDLLSLASAPAYPSSAYLDEEDFARTVHAMGTSLVGWAQDLLARGMFASDARVVGLTSEGNTVAWKGYAAVAAAKVALESAARGMAVELAPYGVRVNVVQAGITDTPALQAIPGNDHLKAQARARNPFHRLTTPRDVADVIYLLATDEAAWINGAIVRVDGGEHVSGATS
jgi:NAD(P)-dependent dehydrogenase (short-subunit alcohol dehydrogenase family)